MTVAFCLQLMNRQIVLDTMPTIFASVEKYDFDLYQAIMFEVIDLPCMDPPNIDREFKVNDVLSIVLIRDLCIYVNLLSISAH